MKMNSADMHNNNTSKISIVLLFKVAWHGIKIVYTTKPLPCIFMCLILLMIGFAPTATVFINRILLDAIVSLLASNQLSQEIHHLTYVLILQLVILLAVKILKLIYSYYVTYIGAHVSIRMNKEVLSKSYQVDYSHFDNSEFHDMLNRAQRESSGRPLNMVMKFGSILTSMITFVSMGTLIAMFSIPLAMLMILICFPIAYAEYVYCRENYKIHYSRSENIRRANCFSSLLVSKQYIHEILSYGLFSYLFNKWFNYSIQFLKQDMDIKRQLTIARGFSECLILVSSIGVTAYVLFINNLDNLFLSVGEIMMYTAAFSGGIVSYKMIQGNAISIYSDLLFLKDLIDFKNINNSVDHFDFSEKERFIINSIEFKNVYFKYPGTNKYILNGVNFSFHRGRLNTIIGLSGTGKSTIIKLLLRLYQPNHGKISINGVDILNYDIGDLRKSIGVLFQNSQPYPVSIKDNIALGNIKHIENFLEIEKVSIRADIDHFIKNIPKEYDAILGKMFKEGHELSLGQWRQLCVARSFMKDASAYVFDEPFANIDKEAATIILTSIKDLVIENKLCILITHHDLSNFDLPNTSFLYSENEKILSKKDLSSHDHDFVAINKVAI